MSDTLTPLTVDFLQWLAAGPRRYAEVMDAWRTSCPRLTVWEDALDRGFVERSFTPGEGACVALTPAGRAFLGAERRRDSGKISLDSVTLVR